MSLSEDEDPDDDFGATRWKENLTDRAKRLHSSRRAFRTSDFVRLLYDESMSPAELAKKWKGDNVEKAESESIGKEDEEFFQTSKHHDDYDTSEGRTIPKFNYGDLEQKWTDPENIEALRQRFSTARLGGDNEDEDSEGDESEFGDEDGEEDEEDVGDGAFEDLEDSKPDDKPEVQGNGIEEVDIEAERAKNARRKEELKLRFEEEDREGFMNDKSNARKEKNEATFGEDEWYDAQKAQIQKQLAINRGEFESLDEQARVKVQGHKAGTYARIVLERVPCEFAEGFNPKFPIIIGGLTTTEERFGFVQIRIKRHRWPQEDFEDWRSADILSWMEAIPDHADLQHLRL